MSDEEQQGVSEIAERSKSAGKKAKILGMSYIINDKPSWILSCVLGFQVSPNDPQSGSPNHQIRRLIPPPPPPHPRLEKIVWEIGNNFEAMV